MSKKKKIKSFYELNLHHDIPDYKKLGWESCEAQYKRFDALANHVSLQGTSLLDVGCGLCNLVEYLEQKQIDVHYTGVDISDPMIECAKEKCLRAELYCTDIFSVDALSGRYFDVVYTSGIFNLNLGNNAVFLQKAIQKFYSLSKSVIAFNLLHHQSTDIEEQYYYFEPEHVRQMLNQSGCDFKKIQVVEGYLGNDFTMICSKE